MAFEPIPLKEQIQVAATTAKTFDSLWLATIQIKTPQPTGPDDPEFTQRDGSIYLEYYPLKSGTGELHRVPVEIRSDKLWDAVAKVPEVAAAVEALLAAIRPLEDFVNG